MVARKMVLVKVILVLVVATMVIVMVKLMDGDIDNNGEINLDSNSDINSFGDAIDSIAKYL